jgi:hypothetical protein
MTRRDHPVFHRKLGYALRASEGGHDRMPYEPGHDDDEVEAQHEGRTRRFGDFDCPDCNANNPHDDGFGDGEEVRCYYCGQEYRAQVSDEGRLRLKTI